MAPLGIEDVVDKLDVDKAAPELHTREVQAAELELDAETLKEIEDILQYKPFFRKIG